MYTVKEVIRYYLCVSQLRNGPDVSAPSLGGRLCGSNVPSFVQTTDNDLHVRFVSDGSNEGQGFKLTFEAHSQGKGFYSFVAMSLLPAQPDLLEIYSSMLSKMYW